MKAEDKEARVGLSYASFLFTGVAVWYYFSLGIWGVLKLIFFSLIAVFSFVVGLIKQENRNSQLFFPVFTVLLLVLPAEKFFLKSRINKSRTPTN